MMNHRIKRAMNWPRNEMNGIDDMNDIKSASTSFNVELIINNDLNPNDTNRTNGASAVTAQTHLLLSAFHPKKNSNTKNHRRRRIHRTDTNKLR